jgi:hypothetical protein
VNSFLTKFTLNINEHFMIPKCSTFFLLRSKHEKGAV